MKRENFLMLVVIALVVLNFGTLGYLLLNKGQQPANLPHRPPGPDKLIIERLKLTPKQVDEFEGLKFEHRSGINHLNRESKEVYTEYFSLLKTDQPDFAAAQTIEQRLAHIQAQKDSVTFMHFVKLRQLCTEEQKPLFDDFVDELGDILVRQPPRPRP